MPNFSGIWTVTQQMQAKGASTWPATPGAPTIGTATAGTAACASVTFTAPGCTGAYPAGITGYRVISTPGCFTQTGASSPLVVTGLTIGTSYTFKAQAQNANGYGALSAASNSVTATVITCATYTTAGTFSWVAPSGVTSVAVVAVGGGAGGTNGGGGSGGGLGYKNNISVTPGNSYTVVVGAGGAGKSYPQSDCWNPGGQSYFISCTGYATGGGGRSAAGWFGTYVGDGGGNGGVGTPGGGYGTRGGGGAGGYAGSGGAGGLYHSISPDPGGAGSAGSGGGGGGGTGGSCAGCTAGAAGAGGGGGGVGLYGQGSSGAGGAAVGRRQNGNRGGGGSGGTGGTVTVTGGNYGGGGGFGGTYYSGCSGVYPTGGNGGGGAVRIVWCVGGARGTPSFPSTNVGA